MTDKELIQVLYRDGYHAAAARMENLLAENKAMSERDKWVSVNERLPELTEKEIEDIKHYSFDHAPEFIVFIEGADIPTVLKFDGKLWFDNSGTWYPITHWMPLPEPPSTEGVE